ncbi:hypothetical protein FQA47_017453 [Oryzias melastigma]|uniref:Uncharacterized protein n=1 Tax=Oryzias melastigma TaxID=30732 RepID=A0A834BRH6_ORYME|nr:hypothetical protein FQA47_017453 [Oryzias melastigma]
MSINVNTNLKAQNSVSIVFTLCVPAVFPVWRGIGAGSSISWSQEWSRCLRWEFDSRDGGPRIPVFD